MKHSIAILAMMLAGLLAVAGCSDEATAPSADGSTQGGVFGGEISGDFDIVLETAIGPDYPLQGPFVIRGRNVRYEGDALVVDLSVLNRGVVPHPEPIGLTFLQLLPEGVTVLNPDNDEHGAGAAIIFHFTNRDVMWTPGEESQPRETRFGVDEGVSIAFFARLDIGMDPNGGSIGGVLWLDKNRNGVMDTDEPGIGGAPMVLETERADSTSVRPDIRRETFTNPDGSYRFDGLPAGHYVVGKGLRLPCQPTTPDPLHVFLVADTSGGVSDFLAANFGCFPEVEPPPIDLPKPGDFIESWGTYSDFVGAVIATRLSVIRCDVAYDERCGQNIVRGPITGKDPNTNVIVIMGSPMRYEPISAAVELDTLTLGDRVEAHIHIDEHDHRIIVKMAPWDGDYDGVQGLVERVHAYPGTVVEVWAVGVRVIVTGETKP